jgi:PilZ domain
VYAALELGCVLEGTALQSGAFHVRRKVRQRVSGEATEQQLSAETPEQTAIKHYAEMQSAPRFPLHLPVELKSASGACQAETQNISANGVLFAMDRDVAVGSQVDFTILLPGDVVGSRCDVQIDCHGRVVRSFEDKGRRGVGVVIDEYHFERA